MPIQNKNDLKNLSSTTYIDNTTGQITPASVRYFNDTLIDSLVDETGYAIDSASWNASLLSLTQSVTNIFANTGSYVTNGQTQSMSVGTASYVDLRGQGVVVNYGNGFISITGSDATDTPTIVSDTAPNPLSVPTGSLWYNTVDTNLYVNYNDGFASYWVSTTVAATFVESSSYSYFAESATTARNALTASYFLTASVTSASLARTASYINVTGSGIGIQWVGDQLVLSASSVGGGAQVILQSTAPTSANPGDLWFDTDDGVMSVWYDDGTSGQWVESNYGGTVGTASYADVSGIALTASWFDVTGSNIDINWFGSQLQLSASVAGATVTVSDTPPSATETGSLWYNSLTGAMYVWYIDSNSSQWVSVNMPGPVATASYAYTASHALTAAYFFTSSVSSASYSVTSDTASVSIYSILAENALQASNALTASLANVATYAQTGGNQNLQSVTTFGNSTSQSIDIRDRLIVNITGSGTLTQGESVEARGEFSHAQGYDTVANGDWSHAEGNGSQANGDASHAEGFNSTANGYGSHAEGDGAIADGYGSHAEGYRAWAVGQRSHAEGSFTLAEGDASHAEGISTWAQGDGSNAAGLGTITQGIASDTRGRYTNAGNDYQSVVGQWNIPLTSTDYQGWFIIGDGTGIPGHPKELHNLFMAGDGKIIISGTLDISGSILGISQSSPQIPYVAGPGIIINDYQISASVLTVNGVTPDANGNIATALTNVITGTSGSLIISSSGDATGSLTEGTVWVVSGETGPASASNGVSYIWDGKEPGEWLKLSSLDIVTADQRYVIQSPSTVFLGTASLATRALTASFYAELDTLQSVTTRNNRTTRSVIIGDTAAVATGINSLALGSTTAASGQQSLAGGIVSNATNRWSLAFGEAVNAYGQSSVALNAYTEASGAYSFAMGHSTKAIGLDSHAEGAYTTAIGVGSHAEGGRYIPTDPGGNFPGGTAIGNASHAEGRQTTSVGVASHAEGISTRANGQGSHAEGEACLSQGLDSHAEGYGTIANGIYSHTEGYLTATHGFTTHAEGDRTTAIGFNSHTEGVLTTAVGNGSHAEGGTSNTGGIRGGMSIGQGSHAEGRETTSVGGFSHAEGYLTTTNGEYSHAQGLHNITNGTYQNVVGQYNRSINSSSAFIVGNGTNDANRSNLIEAFGNTINLNGTVNVNGTPIGGNAVTASYALTASYVSGAVMFNTDTYASVPSVTNIISLTLAEYNALGTKNPNVLYIVRA
jgi:hypothetical protein